MARSIREMLARRESCTDMRERRRQQNGTPSLEEAIPTLRDSTTRNQRSHTSGYNNQFHTRSHPLNHESSLPSYECAVSGSRRHPTTTPRTREGQEALPRYKCTVFQEGMLGIKCELTTPFHFSPNRDWHDVYAVLRGTQLCIHRAKKSRWLSHPRPPIAGRLIKSYTLQHAEVGLAADFKKTELTPRSPLARMVPAAARAKLYETDPHLFEPVREHVIRLRVEQEQVLLCAEKQEQMLDWVEKLCAAIDISQPLDDRSEPRYRSLPRRSRRQRQLGLANLENLDEVSERRLIAEQERILRTLYPHLAVDRAESAAQPPSSPDDPSPNPTADPDREDLDPADVSPPTPTQESTVSPLSNNTTTTTAPPVSTAAAAPFSTPSSTTPTTSSAFPTTSRKPTPPPTPSYAARLRYRRRCAPVLLASAPRASDVLVSDGRRYRLDARRDVLLPFAVAPPAYGAHDVAQRGGVAGDGGVGAEGEGEGGEDGEGEGERFVAEEEGSGREGGAMRIRGRVRVRGRPDVRRAASELESEGSFVESVSEAEESTGEEPAARSVRLDGAEEEEGVSAVGCASPIPTAGSGPGVDVGMEPGKVLKVRDARRRSSPLFDASGLAALLVPKLGTVAEGGEAGYAVLAV